MSGRKFFSQVVGIGLVLSLALAMGGVAFAAAKVEITFVTWDGPERHIPYYNALRSVEKKFNEEHPGIEVKYQYIPGGEYASKITTMTIAGNPPDVIYHDEWQASTYLLDNLVVDLKPFINSDPNAVKGIYPSILKLMQWKGIQYSIGSAHLPMVLWFRKDMFREAGLARPNKGWTWDQLVTYSQKLTKRDNKGEITQYALQGGLGVWIFGSAAWGLSNGYLPIDAKERKINLDKPEFIEVLQFTNDLMYKHQVATRVGVDLPGQVGQPYQTGRVGMVYNGTWMMGDPGYEEYEWGATYIPINKGITPLTSNIVGWFVHKGSRHPKEAWELVKALSEPYAQTLFAQVGFPSVRDDINREYAFKAGKLDDQDRAVFYDTMANMNYLAGDVWRLPNMWQVIDQYSKTEQLILTGQKKPEQIKEIVATIANLIK